jgi:AraC family transcriptional regulator, arabinose operon regulatory protein
MTLPFHNVCINGAPRFTRCERGWQWHPPPMQDFDLWYVLEGVGRIELGSQKIPLAAGSTLIFSPGSKPLGSHDPERRLHVFVSHFDFLDQRGKRILLSADQLPPLGLTIRDNLFFATLAHRCVNAFRRGDELGTAQSRVAFHQMLLHLWEEATHPPPSLVDLKIQELIHSIQSESDKRWSVEELARKSCLSRSQFTRRFTTVTGLAPAQYLIQTRLERATRLIQETDMTLMQIADALGYKNVYFFSRQYKEFMGHPPSSLRKKQTNTREDEL